MTFEFDYQIGPGLRPYGTATYVEAESELIAAAKYAMENAIPFPVRHWLVVIDAIRLDDSGPGVTLLGDAKRSWLTKIAPDMTLSFHVDTTT